MDAYGLFDFEDWKVDSKHFAIHFASQSAHDMWAYTAPTIAMFGQLQSEVRTLFPSFISESHSLFNSQPYDWENFTQRGHRYIDKMFGTNLAPSPLHNQLCQITTGEVPPWFGTASKVGRCTQSVLPSLSRTNSINTCAKIVNHSSSTESAFVASKNLKNVQTIKKSISPLYDKSKLRWNYSLIKNNRVLDSNKIIKLEKRISGWLGDKPQTILNKAGDPIFLSRDGKRKIRFDFNRPYPHESPHLHIEHFINDEWKEISRIYPIDVLHK